MAMLACRPRARAAVETSPKPVEAGETRKNGDTEAFGTPPPAWLRTNGMADCNAASGWTLKANTRVCPVGALKAGLTGMPPKMKARSVGWLAAVMLAEKKKFSGDRKHVPGVGPKG